MVGNRYLTEKLIAYVRTFAIIADDRGKRVGVLLDMEAYQNLANRLSLDIGCLSGLSTDELQALAQSQLATVSPTRLAELLAMKNFDLS